MAATAAAAAAAPTRRHKGLQQLQGALDQLAGEVEELGRNCRVLWTVNDSLVSLNATFKDLVAALDLQSACCQFPQPRVGARPLAPKPKPRPGEGPLAELQIGGAARGAKPRPEALSLANAKLPPKYDSPEQRERLERVLAVLAHLPGGATLSQVANETSLSLITSREYLALLARLGKAEHVKAASGFVYRIPERGAPQPKANARK